MSTQTELHPDAVGMSAFRVLKNGTGRQYSAVEFTRGWAGCEHQLRVFRKLGMVDESNDGYAVLDILDANGDIVQDFNVKDALAWRYVKRILGLVVEGEGR